MATKAEMDHHPLTTIEGMLKGSLKRLGDFFKDPQNFGSMTHDVLRGTSQRYQDALDRCEIQILNAKWVLEHDLAQNQTKRAPKPVEVTNPTKRKLDETTDTIKAHPESPAKKAKTDNEDEADHLSTLDDILKDIETDKGKDGAHPTTSNEPTADLPTEDASRPENHQLTATDQEQPKPAEGDDSKQTEGHGDSIPAAPEVSQDTENAADDNVDFDTLLEGLGDNNDINFDDLDDLNQTNSFDMAFSGAPNIDSSTTGGDASLNALLPGFDASTDTANPAANPTSTSADAATSNSFGLPDMGDDTTTFDDFFGDAMGNTGTGDSKDEDLLNDDSILELGTFDDNWLMES